MKDEREVEVVYSDGVRGHFTPMTEEQVEAERSAVDAFLTRLTEAGLDWRMPRVEDNP